MWWEKRRPEIVEDFDREIYGRVPANLPSVNWVVVNSAREVEDSIPVIKKELEGRVDNSLYPQISVTIKLTLTTPAEASGPVPVIMEFGFVFPPGFRPPAPRPGSPEATSPSWKKQVLDKGWGYAVIVPTSYQADYGAGLTQGIIGLVNKGQLRKADDWGALRAWAWGASRAMDYFETDKTVDAKHIGIEGHSRYGKATLVTMAYDPRFAVAFVSSSGEGGAKLHRRNAGEIVENIASSGEYHWVAPNFIKYAGPLNWNDLPVDAHELIALCAPRLTFISYGVPERGDAKWLDHQGSYMAAVAAGPVFRLLKAKDLGTSDDYMKEKMPAVNVSMLNGQLAWRQHDGGHTDGPNWKYFIPWADKFFKRVPPPPPAK